MFRVGLGSSLENAVNIYTDGSVRPKEGMASGAGFVVVTIDTDGNESTDEHLLAGYKTGTINEMELTAAISGLDYVIKNTEKFSQFEKIAIFTDSSYVEKNFPKAKFVWSANGWKTQSGAPVKNRELWKKLLRLVKKSPMQVEIKWVKAHRGNPHNTTADKLAKTSSSQPLHSSRSVSAPAKKWSPYRTQRGSIELSGQEMIIRIFGWKAVSGTKETEYRYEVVSPDCTNYLLADFIYYKGVLHRGHCYRVKVNSNNRYPKIEQVIEEVDCSLYRR